MEELIDMEANAICITCGTTRQNPVNSFCINGHDDWFEPYREDEHTTRRALNRFNVSVEEICHVVNEGHGLPNQQQSIDGIS